MPSPPEKQKGNHKRLEVEQAIFNKDAGGHSVDFKRRRKKLKDTEPYIKIYIQDSVYLFSFEQVAYSLFLFLFNSFWRLVRTEA